MFVFKIKILDMTTSDSTKSFASVAATGGYAKGTAGSGQMGDSGFKTRQRPDAIRNSNIVAAKGNFQIVF